MCKLLIMDNENYLNVSGDYKNVGIHSASMCHNLIFVTENIMNLSQNHNQSQSQNQNHLKDDHLSVYCQNG